jgi:hypothetical protein
VWPRKTIDPEHFVVSWWFGSLIIHDEPAAYY